MRHITKDAERHPSIHVPLRAPSRALAAALPRATAAIALFASACAVQADDPAAREAAASPEAAASESQAWDSQDGNPTHATHSYLTEHAIDALKARWPALEAHRARIVDGANRELHELPVSDPEQEALRQEAIGTNWACARPSVVWQHAREDWANGDPDHALWLVGILLHYVEDMGVPAHALHVIHQGTWAQHDDFELMALQRWSPSYAAVNRVDPRFDDPSDYVAFDGAWAADDFQATWPGVTYTRTFFPMTWLFASSKTTGFVRDRQGRTATAAAWALESAMRGFDAIDAAR